MTTDSVAGGEPEGFPHQGGHRLVGFSGDGRVHAGGRGHRGQQGARPRDQTVRRGMDRIFVCPDESAGPPGHGGGGRQHVEIERPGPPDHGGHRLAGLDPTPSSPPGRPGLRAHPLRPAPAPTARRRAGRPPPRPTRPDPRRLAFTPQPPSRSTSSAVVGAELLVANTTRLPPVRRASTAPATSPMGWPDNQITPSRSTIHKVAEAKAAPPAAAGAVIGSAVSEEPASPGATRVPLRVRRVDTAN